MTPHAPRARYRASAVLGRQAPGSKVTAPRTARKCAERRRFQISTSAMSGAHRRMQAPRRQKERAAVATLKVFGEGMPKRHARRVTPSSLTRCKFPYPGVQFAHVLRRLCDPTANRLGDRVPVGSTCRGGRRWPHHLVVPIVSSRSLAPSSAITPCRSKLPSPSLASMLTSRAAPCRDGIPSLDSSARVCRQR